MRTKTRIAILCYGLTVKIKIGGLHRTKATINNIFPSLKSNMIQDPSTPAKFSFNNYSFISFYHSHLISIARGKGWGEIGVIQFSNSNFFLISENSTWFFYLLFVHDLLHTSRNALAMYYCLPFSALLSSDGMV